MEKRKDNFILRYFKNARLCEKVEFFVLLAVLIAIQSVFVNRLSTFFVLDDEFGYFANAAYFAGWDWSSAVDHIAYYSYGYSLLLTPLFWIFSSAASLYKAAIILNVILIGGCFCLAKLVAKKLAPELSGRLLNVICFVICLYPSYIVMSKIAHTETLQYFLFWLITYTVLSVSEKPKVWKTAVLALEIIYMYSVHQRSLGTAVAVALVIIVMFLKRRINWKHLVSFAAVIAVCLVAHKFIKQALIDDLRGASSASNANDFGYMTSRLDYVLSGPGIKNLLKRTSGQLYYVAAASLGFGFLGFIETFFKNIDTIRFTSKKKNTDLLKEQPVNYIYIFMFVAMCMTAAISIYFVTIEQGRIDTMIYGRYLEVAMGPPILLGFITLIKNEKFTDLKAAGVAVCAAILTMLAHKFAISTTDINSFGATSTISLKFLPNGAMHWQILKNGLFAVAVFVIFAVLTNKFIRQKWVSAIAVIAVSVMFITTGFANAKFTVISMISEDAKYSTLVTKREEDGENWPVYYTIYGNDFTRNRPSAFIQLRMMEEPLICVDKEEIKNYTEDKYLFVYNEINEETIELVSGYELMMMGGELMLFKSGGEGIAEGISISGFSTAAGALNEGTSVTSAGEEAVFMYGPYLNISAGDYVITATVKCESYTEGTEKLGYIDVVSGGGKHIHGLFDIMAEDLEDGKIEVEIPISYADDFRSLEIRSTATKDSIIKISDVRLNINNTATEE